MFPLPDHRERRGRWGRLYGSSAAFALARAAARHDGPLLLVAGDVRQAERYEAELSFFLGGELPVLPFPDWETLPYDVFSPHQDIVSQRLAALAALPDLRRGIVVVAATTLMQRLAPPEHVAGGVLVYAVGERVDPTELRRRLDHAGYAMVSQVSEPGELAVRGSLIDVFPTGAEAPFRLDLFDDEIESIRLFDPATQLSGERLDAMRVLPAREFPLDEDAISGFRQRFRQRFEGDPTRAHVYREVSEGIAGGGLEYYLPLFFDRTVSLAGHLPEDTLVVADAELEAELADHWSDIRERYEQRAHDRERPLLAPDEVFVDPDELAAQLDAFPRLELHRMELPADGTNLPFSPPPRLPVEARADDSLAALRAFLEDFGGRVLLIAESAGRREALLEMLRSRRLQPRSVAGWSEFAVGDATLGISVAPLEEGLVSNEPALAIVVEEQLLGRRARSRRRRRAARDPQTIIRDLTDLRPGAPVVHETYGVGRFLGLQSLEVAGHEAEFLTLEYAGGDKLYVPVHALHLISRYTGSAPDTAPLHRLGSDQWQKARRKAAQKIRDAAAELLDIYARRAARHGRRFALEEADYRAFVQGFPFEETADQASTIEAVLEDLRGEQPMDRVVCGDVGFGKTEVALRAAFVAVSGGAQVAVLVPTTLLAEQHLQTFRDRFADWPVRVEGMSRFHRGKEADAIVDGLASGAIDIVIGTHKLLQGSVRFRDLGLIIIDEEHRFGVRHKERLKALRSEVDVLTLTATPIPRTLNMSMGGLRDLSVIATPPTERLAVKTFVTDWNDTLLREACLREIRRGGQVFFVHNTVKTIERVAATVADLVPEAKLRVAHGQMRERDLERTMLDFYHRRFNLLVCTTIVESGIDIPTANTIIIDRADRLGLAQLHQLRGRVGRSHHRAYAYLIAPPRRVLTADAVKRLEAIEAMEDLGAGFTLATHDLEIRGAGELLGEEQSGQMHEIGFTLYVELLERAVRAMKAGEEPELEQPLHHGPEVDLHEAALLPEDYLPDVHMRLVLYKRIASAADEAALEELQVEMIDRFGLLPAEAKRLFAITRVKLAAMPLGIERIDAGLAGGRLVFEAGTAVEPLSLVKLVQSDPERFRLEGQNQLRFKGDFPDFEQRCRGVEAILSRLAARTDRSAAAS